MKFTLQILKALFFGFLGGAIAIIVWNQNPVRAGERHPSFSGLQLVRKDGKPYAILEQGKGSSSKLAFFNYNQKPLLEIGIDQKEFLLLFYPRIKPIQNPR